MVKWLIQPVKVEAGKIEQLISLLEKADIEYDIVYPLNGKILKNNKEDYVFEPGKKYFVCGSYPLTRYAHEKIPGSVFSLENYNFEDFMNIFGSENFVNSNCKVVQSKEIDWIEEEYFVRPVDDTKAFNGGIYNKNNLKYDGEVIVANLKHIRREYRFFVIDGQIVGKSLYKVNGSLEESEIVDPGAENFALEMIKKFNEPGFVIDIADVDETYKIMELNCFNASGFYAINLYKLVVAVYDFYNKNSNFE